MSRTGWPRLPSNGMAGSSHTVDATYNGDDTSGGFHGSTAPQLAVTVSPDTTTTTLTQPVTNVPATGGKRTYVGQAATFTVTVRSTHGGTPTGSVTFFTDGATILQAGVTFSSSAGVRRRPPTPPPAYAPARTGSWRSTATLRATTPSAAAAP